MCAPCADAQTSLDPCSHGWEREEGRAAADSTVDVDAILQIPQMARAGGCLSLPEKPFTDIETHTCITWKDCTDSSRFFFFFQECYEF